MSFVTQINMELEKGEYYLLRELKVPDQLIAGFRESYLRGGRVIIKSDNVLQTVYRLQFERLLNINYASFLRSDWTISNSPIELPLSDIGLVPIHLEEHRANQYFLPIGPRLLLEAVLPFDRSADPMEYSVSGHEFTAEEAEDRLDAICLSAVIEIIWSRQDPNILKIMDRAKKKGVVFHEIVNLEHVTSAGLKGASTGYRLQVVSGEDYVRFVHSFVKPPAAASLGA